MARWSVLRWIAAACAVSLLAVVVLVLCAPLWIDAGSVQAKVAQWVGEASGGHARFARVDLHYLPLPGIVLIEPGYSMPGMVEVAAKSGTIDLDFLALLRGRVQPRSVRLEHPTVRVSLPEPEPDPTPFSLKQTEDSLRKVVAAIADAAPDAVVEIVDGNLEFRIGSRAPLQARNVGIRFAVVDGTLEAHVSGTADLWQKLDATARLARDSLAGEGRIEIAGLALDRIGAIAGLGDQWPVERATVQGTLKWQMRGLVDAQAEASLTSPSLVVRAGKGRLDAQGAAIDATARIHGGVMSVTVGRASLETPEIAATANLKWSEAAGYQVEARTGDLDIPVLHSLAQGLAPDVDWLAHPPASLAAGTILTLQFASHALTIDGLAQPAAMQAQGEIAGVELVVPAYDLHLHEVTATASLKEGELRVEQVGARLEQSKARDGLFVTRLGATPMPLHVELVVDTNLPEALAISKRVVTDRGAREQMDRLKQLEGSAVVRVMLAGDVEHMRPSVLVQSLNGTMTHDTLPFPLRIARGTVLYADTAISAEGVDGSLGPIAFDGLGAHLALKSPYRVIGGHGSAIIALEPLLRWAKQQPDFKQSLEPLTSASGNLVVKLSGLEGSVRTPKDLLFRVTASPQQVTIKAPTLAPPVTLHGGTIAVDPRALAASGVSVSALDGRLEISGHTDDYRDGIDELEANVAGRLGLELLGWLHMKASLPDGLRLRGAVALSDVSAKWRKSGAMNASGKVAVTGGPAIGFAVSRTPDRIELSNLTVRDDGSDATLGGRLEGTRFEATFKGKLAGTSIANMFMQPPVTLTEMSGDLQIDGDWKRAGHGTGTGFLSGSGIHLPLRVPEPLNIEAFSLEAKGSLITIQSAMLEAGPNRLAISGSIDRSKEKYRVDADLRSDEITLPAPKETTETKPDQTTAAAETRQNLSILDRVPLTGEVRFDIRRLRRGPLEVTPLVGSAALETGHLDLRIREASVCAISLVGSGGLTSTTMSLEIAAHARDVDLDKSVACLTEQRLSVTGRVDVDIEMKAQGEPGALLDHVEGMFSALSRDGRIEKFDTLTKVFDLLNVTEVVNGSLPDLKTKGMAYRSASIKGRIAGRTVHFDEAVLDATGVKIAAQGSASYGTRKVDVNVLVAPLQTANRFLDKLPIIGRIFGGTVLALPVRVGGTFDKPIIIPLGARAVASRLVDIIGNTVKLPVDLVTTMSTEANGKGAKTEPAPKP